MFPKIYSVREARSKLTAFGINEELQDQAIIEK